MKNGGSSLNQDCREARRRVEKTTMKKLQKERESAWRRDKFFFNMRDSIILKGKAGSTIKTVADKWIKLGEILKNNGPI